MSFDMSDSWTLLAGDAQRSLDGLSLSLQMGIDGTQQAHLHARDLSVAFSSLGMEDAAESVEEVARFLLMKHPGVIEVAHRFVPLWSAAIRQVMSGPADLSVVEGHDLQSLMQQLRQLESTAANSAQAFEAVVPRVSAQWVPEVHAEVEPPSLAVLPSPIHSPESAPSAPSSLQVQTVWVESMAHVRGVEVLREEGLALMQRARILNQSEDDRTPLQVDALLSELQDWTLRLGQMSLHEWFQFTRPELEDVWVDAQVLQALEPLRYWFGKANRMTASVRGLVVHLDLMDVVARAEEVKQAADILAALRGQIHNTETGLRLSFPSSLQRMRMVPFGIGGQRYVVPAAQFVQEQQASAQGGQRQLIVRAGTTTKSLNVDTIWAHEHMNLFEVPVVMPRPPWLTGVAITQSGEACFCVTPL